MGELDIIDGFVYHLSFSDSYPTVISRHHSGYCIILFIIPGLSVLFFKAQDPDEKVIVGSIDIDFLDWVLLQQKIAGFHYWYGNNPCDRAP